MGFQARRLSIESAQDDQNSTGLEAHRTSLTAETAATFQETECGGRESKQG